MPEQDASAEQIRRNRAKRGRLLSAALDAFPTAQLHAYGEASELYRNLVDLSAIDELQPMLVTRLGRTMRSYRRLADDYLRQHGHSIQRWQTLFELATNPPGQTLTSISLRVGMIGSALVGLLDDLERDGLIQRMVDSKDRRSKLIKLTPAGEEAVAEIFNLMAKLRQQFLDGVLQSEMLLMLDVVDLMRSNLEKMGNPDHKAMF